MTAPLAWLRVYEPLAAFPPAERARWQAYLADRPGWSALDGAELEHRSGVQALRGAAPELLPELAEHAYLAELDGVRLLCPWDTRLRSLEALAEVAAELPEQLWPAYGIAELARSADALLVAHRAQHPHERRHQLSSSWQVPLRWFVAVDAAEREVQPGGPANGRGTTARHLTGRVLRYRTAMSRARRRTARALEVLRRTVDDGAATAGVEQLGRWLEEFHPRSLVELDYGGLVHLLDDAALEADQSAGDVAGALAALGRGEPARAAEAYGRVTRRMAALQAVEAAS